MISINAERFNSSGNVVREEEISVNRIGSTVYLQISNNKNDIVKNWSIPAAEWEKLKEV